MNLGRYNKALAAGAGGGTAGFIAAVQALPEPVAALDVVVIVAGMTVLPAIFAYFSPRNEE